VCKYGKTFNHIRKISDYASVVLVERGDTVTCIKNRYTNRTVWGCEGLKFKRIRESELEGFSVEIAKYYGRNIYIVLDE